MQSWIPPPGSGQQHSPSTPQMPTTTTNPLKRKISSPPDHDNIDTSSAAVLTNSAAASAKSPTTKQQRPQPIKRACNECRQQKLKCNVTNVEHGQVIDPCTRCVKHNLQCTIDPAFRRLEKRQHTADLERELQLLRQHNAELRAAIQSVPEHVRPATAPGLYHQPSSPLNTLALQHAYFPQNKSSSSAHLNPNEAAATRSLLHLAQGPAHTASTEPTQTRLANVTLSRQQISDLFALYHHRYHPHLPVLAEYIDPQDCFRSCPLLYWTVICVAARRYDARPGLLIDLKKPLTQLLWDTLGSSPQSYHIVKAICLLCTWPLPTKSTSTDPSLTLCGTMLSLAMEFGLHRPSQAQEFSRNQIEVREDDIRDRMNTWVAVNIVAQNVSTGYGMPQLTQWNWYTHGVSLGTIAPAFLNRCMIERFVDKVTRQLYSIQRDTAGQPDEASRALTIESLQNEYNELETTVKSRNPSIIDTLHLQIACLHIRLSAFFDSPDAPTYRSDLRMLYVAAATLLQTFLAKQPGTRYDGAASSATYPGAISSRYATNYIMQMILAAGCTLFKLLNSFFESQIDTAGRQLFSQTVSALRSISVAPNDLPQRLAEVLAQLWQASSEGNGTGNDRRNSGARFHNNGRSSSPPPSMTITRSKPAVKIDDTLQLRVRCRMSMSLVYDSVWRWRDRFGAVRNLDSMVEHPTQTDGSAALPRPPTLSMHEPVTNLIGDAHQAGQPSQISAPDHAAHQQYATGQSSRADLGSLSINGEGVQLTSPMMHPVHSPSTGPDQVISEPPGFVTHGQQSLSAMDLVFDEWSTGNGGTGNGAPVPFDSLGWALNLYPEYDTADGIGYS